MKITCYLDGDLPKKTLDIPGISYNQYPKKGELIMNDYICYEVDLVVWNFDVPELEIWLKTSLVSIR